MKINADTKLIALIGDPVSKSLSPFIHNYVFKKMGYNNSYMAFTVEKEDLKSAIGSMKTLGVKGFNATIPHKIPLLDIVDEIDPYAKQLQAINTVKIVDGKLYGYNTDGPGLIDVLIDHGINISSLNILILGAGGAARGIALALTLNGCKSIGIMNRTSSKSQLLADMVNNLDSEVKGVAIFKDDELFKYDLVINTTSVGMYPNVEESPIEINRLRKDAVLFDIVYKPHKTKFLKSGEEQGNPIIYGIEMLIYQALIAEEIWMDTKLDKKVFKDELIGIAIENKLLL